MGGFFFCSCWLHISPECGIVIKRGSTTPVIGLGIMAVYGIMELFPLSAFMEFATIVFVTGFVSGEDSKE